MRKWPFADFLPDGRLAYRPDTAWQHYRELRECLAGWLWAEGVRDEGALHMLTANFDAAVRSRKEAWREWQIRTRPPATDSGARSLLFTRDELQFLADHFEGANDPEAAAILSKAIAALVPKP